MFNEMKLSLETDVVGAGSEPENVMRKPVRLCGMRPKWVVELKTDDLP